MLLMLLMINTSMKKLTEKSSICKVDDFFRAAPSYGTGAVWKERGLMSFLFGYIYLYILLLRYIVIYLEL